MNQGHKPHSLECFPVIVESVGAVIHYTCNSPKQLVLERYGIISRGKSFGCGDNREVLQIPVLLYKKKGILLERDKSTLQINSERLLSTLH